MPPIFRTLGPVAPPQLPQDIANKGYVDSAIANISPDVLTYFRLSDTQVVGAGSPALYSASADVGLGNIAQGSGANNDFSRSPFPIKIVRYGMTYQPTTILAYNNFLNQTYTMSLFRYNPSNLEPPAVLLTSSNLLPQIKYLDVLESLVNLGVGANDVYQWTVATQGGATNIGTINLIMWYEFQPITTTQYEAEKEDQEKKIQKLNEELKDKDWYKRIMKDLKNQLNDTKK